MEGGGHGTGASPCPWGDTEGLGARGGCGCPTGGSRTEPPLLAVTVPMGVLRGAEPPCCPPAKWVPWDRITEYLGSGGTLKGHRDKGQGQGQGHLSLQAPFNRPPSLPGMGHKHLRGSRPCPSPPETPSLHPIKPTLLQFKTFIPYPVPPGPGESFSPFSSQGPVGKARPWPGAARGHWGQRWWELLGTGGACGVSGVPTALSSVG